MSFDLDGYFERIGWGGGTAPTLETVTGLLLAHASRIPFENLDVLLGRPVRIDLDSIVSKLVAGRRGGYCFEHATLFAAVLEQLGLRPVTHSARVVLFSPPHESPRGHMFLTVPLPEGVFVVDPGFGGPGALHPVPLEADPAAGDTAPFTMSRSDGSWALRRHDGDASADLWMSTLEHDHPVDFEMANHFTQTHPASPFVARIMMSAVTPTGRLSVMNRDVTMLGDRGPTAFQLADRTALRALLVEHFGFDCPAVEHLRVPTIPEWS